MNEIEARRVALMAEAARPYILTGDPDLAERLADELVRNVAAVLVLDSQVDPEEVARAALQSRVRDFDLRVYSLLGCASAIAGAWRAVVSEVE